MTYDAPKIGWWESVENFFVWANTKSIESIKKLQVPIIAINSDHQPTNVEAFQKYSPLFTLKTISTKGHIVMWHAPEIFNKLLEDSIKELMNRN